MHIHTTLLPLALLASPLLLAAEFCADPRPSDVLKSDVDALAHSSRIDDVAHRQRWGVAEFARPVRVTEEQVCKRASQAYFAILAEVVPSLFGDVAPTPVEVIELGGVYFVDDQRDREEYWEVMVFNSQWQRLHGYGGGA